MARLSLQYIAGYVDGEGYIGLVKRTSPGKSGIAIRPVVQIGNTHLYLPNSISIHPSKKKTFETQNKEYAAYALENRFGKFVFLQEIKKTEFSEEVGGGILIPLPDFKSFVDFLNEFNKEVDKLMGS